MSSSKNRNASGSKAFDSQAESSVAAPVPGKSKGKGRPPKKEPPRERPVSKFHDLLMHGVKPWDPDANEFYDALVKARIELDKQLDAMDAQDAAR